MSEGSEYLSRGVWFWAPFLGLLAFELQESLGLHPGVFPGRILGVPGTFSAVPKHRRRNQPAEPEEPNSGSKFFGMENPAPAESTAFNAAGGQTLAFFPQG